jgi:hypothetical protein
MDRPGAGAVLGLWPGAWAFPMGVPSGASFPQFPLPATSNRLTLSLDKLSGKLSGNFPLEIVDRRYGMLAKSDENDAEESVAQAEDRREKFVRLAESRTANAIKAIRVIGKLGNKSAYDFTEVDVKKIVGALSREIDALKARMTSSGGKETIDFKL